MDKKQCPLCDLKTAMMEDYREKDVGIRVSCENCGQYVIYSDSLRLLYEDYRDRRYVLSGLSRDRTDMQLSPLMIKTDNLEELLNNTIASSDVFEMMDRILIYVYRKTKYNGGFVTLRASEYAIAYARNLEEFKFLVSKLIELKHIENPGENEYRLTVEGWKRIVEIRRFVRKGNQCFVAMWFDSSMDIFEQGVRHALKQTGYEPIIIKDVEHNDKICDKIVAEIRKSSLMIADFSGHRGNVYFEAG